jgi:protein-disulfide isomerase/serine/threonine protein kinase
MIESLSPAPGSVFAGVYRILKSLGEQDGVASFLAEQQGAATPRTLKILSPRLVDDPALRARFEPDLRVGARVVSPSVAPILDAGIDAASGQPWLAREALKGESLESFAEGRGAITVGEVADLFEQLCHGVGAIHAAGLAHQDLRPATIFLETPSTPGIPWRVRVLDLGLAPFLAAARRTSAVGEPLWMAPEQADARPPIQATADVWSLGLIAFFLLVGKSYWKGAPAGSMLPAAVHQEVVFDPIIAASTRAAELGVVGRIPGGFDAWFARCVARQPGERFPDARAALDALLSTWGVRARAPLPSFSLNEDAPRAPLPSFSLNEGPGQPGPSRGPLPSFPLGFEGVGGSSPPPANPQRTPSFGPPPMGPGPGAPQGYGYPQQGYGPPPQPTWGGAPPKRASNPLPWILAGVGLLVGLIIVGSIAYAAVTRFRERSLEAAAAIAAATTEEGSIPISPQDPSWGSRNAPVTIVEFGDFECPYCKKVDVTLAALKTQYGPETLRIVWKNNPLESHKGARPAAIAAMAVFDLGGNEAFWRFHDHAFAAQDALSDESFASWALDAGVDMVKWRQAVTAQASAFKIDTDAAIGKAAGVKGTPAFFINGVHVGGAQPITKFTQVIEEQQTAARTAIASGTRPEDVYVTLSLANKGKNAAVGDDGTAPKDETTVWRVPVGGSPARGLASAPVTIVEFGDFQCPFCFRSEKVLTAARERFGARIRIVWKHNPLAFHGHAAPAAELAIQAFTEQGDAGFWQIHDLLYENQAHIEDTDLIALGKRLHVRGAAAAIAGKKYDAQIKADQRLATSLDAKGTPTFFINGRRLVGAQPIEKFATMIEEEIHHAEEIVARGVAPADVYAEIQKSAVSGK